MEKEMFTKREAIPKALWQFKRFWKNRSGQSFAFKKLQKSVAQFITCQKYHPPRHNTPLFLRIITKLIILSQSLQVNITNYSTNRIIWRTTTFPKAASGTPSSIPAKPAISPPINTKKITDNGWSPTLSPNIFGPITDPSSWFETAQNRNPKMAQCRRWGRMPYSGSGDCNLQRG